MSTQTLKLKSSQIRLTTKIKRALSQCPVNDFLTNQNKLQYTDNIENGLYVQSMHNRAKELSSIFCILLLVNALMLYVFYELDHSDSLYAEVWFFLSYAVHIFCSNILLTIGVFLILVYVMDYQHLPTLSKYQYKYTQPLLTIIFFFISHPSPWFIWTQVNISYDGSNFQNGQFYFKINYILMLISIIKSAILFLANYLNTTPYIGPRPNRIKKIYSVTAEDTIYAVRCLFRDMPIKIFGSFVCLGFAYFSFCIKVTQSAVPVQNNPFVYYENCFWFILVTSVTVGYGDMRIFSHLGYTILLFCMVWSSLCISATLVILVNTFNLSSKQEAALTTQNRIEGNLEYKDQCRLYIRISCWRLWQNYKRGTQLRQDMIERKMRKKLINIRRVTKSFNSTSNITELAQRQFDNIKINNDYLLKNNQQMINFIGNHIFSEQLFHQYGGGSKKEVEDITYPEQQNMQPQTDEMIQKMNQTAMSNFSRGSKKTSNHIKIRMMKVPTSESEISEYKSKKFL